MKIKKKSPEMAIFEKPLKFDTKMLYFCFQNYRNFGGFETFIFNLIPNSYLVAESIASFSDTNNVRILIEHFESNG